MKVVFSVCVLVAVALAAPAPEPSASQQAPVLQILEKQPETYRGKRSHFGGGGSIGVPYYSPCGSAPIPALAPYHAPAYGAHSYASHGLPHGYGYGVPQYRDMDDQEMFAFSDMDPMMSDHIPMMSRLAYPAAAALPYAGGALPGLVAPATTGPAFGVFPNAPNASPCSVPLLLSCSPSIVPGTLVNAHPSPSYDAYRADDMEPKEEPQPHQHQHQHQHSHHGQQPSDEPQTDNTHMHQ